MTKETQQPLVDKIALVMKRFKLFLELKWSSPFIWTVDFYTNRSREQRVVSEKALPFNSVGFRPDLFQSSIQFSYGQLLFLTGQAGATVYITGRTLRSTNGLGSLEETAAEVCVETFAFDAKSLLDKTPVLDSR